MALTIVDHMSNASYVTYNNQKFIFSTGLSPVLHKTTVQQRESEGQECHRCYDLCRNIAQGHMNANAVAQALSVSW